MLRLRRGSDAATNAPGPWRIFSLLNESFPRKPDFIMIGTSQPSPHFVSPLSLPAPLMKTTISMIHLTSWLALLFLANTGVAQEKKFDFTKDPVFQKLLGDWKGEGTLAGSDGTTISIKEEWTGKITESGTLLMSGTRQWNDEMHQFSWEFVPNPTTDLIVVAYKASNAGEEPIRFEASVSQADFSIQLKAPIGSQGELVIVNRFVTKGGKVTMVGEVSLKDDTQTETLKGTVTHHHRQP